jgi:hypothetical protein
MKTWKRNKVDYMKEKARKEKNIRRNRKLNTKKVSDEVLA